jgi:hypothetical protein
MKTRWALTTIAVILAGYFVATPSASAATRYAASNGSGTTCSSTSPCSLSTAVGSAASGDMVIVNPGNYSGVTISTPNLTVTTTSAVITNLGTETCGRATWLTSTILSKGGAAGCGTFNGTDNRPLITGTVTITASGVTLQYMRVQKSTSRADDSGSVIDVKAENVTLRNNEIFNGGQGVYVWVKRNVTVSHNWIHQLGIKGTSFDTHGVGVCGSGTESTSFATQILVQSNTINDYGGDGVQEQTNAYCSGTFSYLTVEYNYIRDADEQCGDFKGTRFLRWHGNDCSVAPGGGVVGTNDPAVVAKTDWDIWDNFFHDNQEYAINWAQTANCSRWHIWNNLFVRTDQGPAFNEGTVQLCGDAGTYVVFNTFVDNTNGNATPRSWGIYNYGALGGGNTGNNIRNNIFYRNGTGSDDRGHMSNISGEDGGTPNTNYVNTPTAASSCGTGCQVGTNPITACFATGNCPGFTDITNDDYRLVSGSPAIAVGLGVGSHVSLTDAGNFTPSHDITGSVRPAKPSLGPFEAGASTITAPAAPTNVKIIK